jgi:hypothetical protein
MEQNNNPTAVGQILDKDGRDITDKLNRDHADFDLDLYMMYLCRTIEKELNDLEWKRESEFKKTTESIVKIIQTYKNTPKPKESVRKSLKRMRIKF